MWSQKSEIEKSGAQLVFIGNGPVWAIKGFKEDLKIDGEVYTDPTLEIFKAAALRRGKWETLGFRAFFNVIRLYLKGYRQTGVVGDPWQQGGVVIVKSDGRIVYTHADRALGDDAPLRDILKALR